jgi:hypothetical protein
MSLILQIKMGIFSGEQSNTNTEGRQAKAGLPFRTCAEICQIRLD